MGRFLYNILLNLDEDANVFIIGFVVVILNLFGVKNQVPAAGNAHYTVSQTLSEMRERGMRTGCIGCKILTWLQNNIFNKSGDHCTEAMQNVPEDIHIG